MDVESYIHPFNPIFFFLIAEKSPEIFSKQKEYIFNSESFALNWHMFVAPTNKKLLLPL